MDNIHDITKIKKAKLIVKELEMALQVIELSIVGLKPFKKYTGIKETIYSLNDNKETLNFHLEEWTEILNSKGKT